MSPKRKKSTGRRKKAVNKKPLRRTASRLYRLILLLAGLMVGIFTPWLVWLNYVVTDEFEGRKWDLPSRVYARPLSLYPGLQISAAAFETELRVAGYKSKVSASSPGTYSSSGGTYQVHRRSFRFDDGVQDALRFRVRLSNGSISALSSDAGALDLVRLDPAEIASIFPLHDEDRTLVAIEEVPELLLTGLQAVEDRNFKSHPGIHLRGIFRALVANIKAGKAVQGGSTLTQQLVKNYYLSNERTLTRKVNEAFMALLLELHYEKAEILEAYLNEVHLGQQGSHGIHGFSRASEFYFGESLDQLASGQIALLVGLVRGASWYNPRRNPERARARRDQVLDIFEQAGLISASASKSAKEKPLGVSQTVHTGRSRYPAFVDLVRRQLRSDYQEDDLKNEGLRIFTTLAPYEQEAAENAVVSGMKALTDRGLPASLQSALVLVDVASGEVRAVVGDRLPGRDGFNRALNARRQIGSVIKPLVYLLALEHDADYNLMTRIMDEPISLKQPDGSIWSPANYDKISHGELSLLEALIRSYNQATVRLGLNIGVHQLIARLEKLGIDAPIDAVPATLLGAVELTPIEVAQIYQSLAAGGYTVRLRAVTAVQTSGGETLNRYPLRLMPQPRRDAVAVLNYALTQVVEKGTARSLPGLLGSDAIIAGKTGTTNERRDSWFVGYTRDRLAVIWVGNDDNTPAGVTGGNAAMRLWAALFRTLPLKSVDLDMPEGAYWTWVDPVLNARTDKSCKGAEQLPFIAGTEPRSETPCLARLDRGDKKSIWRKWFGRN